jgi:hypothetical protein
MSYTQPTEQDLDNAIWLDLGFSFSEAHQGWLSVFARQLAEAHEGSTRKDVLSTDAETLRYLLANLYRAHIADPNRYVIIPLGRGDYSRSNLWGPSPVGYRSVSRVMDYLRGSTPPYLEQRGGGFDRDRQQGLAARFRCLESLVHLIEEQLSSVENAGPIPSAADTSVPPEDPPPLTRNTFDTPKILSDPHSTRWLDPRYFTHKPISPTVWLKDDQKKYIPFKHTNETRRMEANLEAYNAFLQDHWTDLLVPDETLITICTYAYQRQRQADRNEAEATFEDPKDAFSLCFKRRLFRSFNNSSFDQGGRFYGGWWQNIPSEYRRDVTINWYPAHEADYSGMQLAMLYAMNGVRLDSDPYAIEGVPTDYRSVIKKALLKLINATGRMRPIPQDQLPEGWTWLKLLEAITTKHDPIANHFRTGIGIQLQRVDADIAETVMLTAMEEGKLILPVHDSFLTMQMSRERLTEMMAEAYTHHMGAEIGIKPEHGWLDELPPEAFEMDALGVEDITDRITEIENQNGYDKYRKRRKDWLDLMGEGWGHRHTFLP